MSASPAQSGQAAAEAEELLARLIRFNTVNPPGNERAAQEYLAEHLTRAGFECELLGAEPERPNLVARLRADSAQEGPTLCYLGHVDTVLADPSAWTRDPWSGDIADGHLWGRGALERKSQAAAEGAAGGWGGAGEEVAGGGGERSGGGAGALGLAPCARRAVDRGRRRRGDRRFPGRGMDHEEPSGEGALRPVEQRGRRGGVRGRRAALLRRVLRGEGRVPLHGDDGRRGRPCVDAGHGR